MLTLGVDIGTSSLKLGAVDVQNGQLVAWAGSEYSLTHPQPGWSQLAADNYWSAFKICLSEIAKTVDLKKIQAISISGQGQSFVPIDANNSTLQDAWTWIDNRAGTQSASLNNTFSKEETFRQTGCVGFSAGLFASMVKYISENDPETFEQTAKFLTSNSYLIWRLTNESIIDENQAAMIGLYNWHEKKWWAEALANVGLSVSQLPKVLPSGSPVAKINPQIANDLDLSKDVLVVSGANDQTANAVGAGLLSEGNTLIVLGTALVVYNVLANEEQPIMGGIWSPYPTSGRSYQLGCTNSGCGTLDWTKKMFAPNLDYPELFNEASKAKIGCDGVTCLIDLDDKADFDGEYRGIFAGLSRKTDRGEIIRSVLEGIAFSVRELSENMNWDLRNSIVKTVGGGARSDLWMQIHADVLGCTIQRIDHDQSGVVGAAIMAGVASNLFESYESAVETCVRPAKTFNAIPENVIEYETAYQRFKKLRKAGDEFYTI